MAETINPADATRLLGVKLATFADQAKEQLRAAGIEPDHRCSTCAFRAGTIPNTRAPGTALDALKCLIEHHPFGCHHHKSPDGLPTRLCGGFVNILVAEVEAGSKPSFPATAPWPFSDERDDTPLANGGVVCG